MIATRNARRDEDELVATLYLPPFFNSMSSSSLSICSIVSFSKLNSDINRDDWLYDWLLIALKFKIYFKSKIYFNDPKMNLKYKDFC